MHMKKLFILALTPLLLISHKAYSGDSFTNVEQKLFELSKQIEVLQSEVQQLKAENRQYKSHSSNIAITNDGESDQALSAVNLAVDELPAIDSQQSSHVLSNPWWKNIQVNGFAAAGFYDTGSTGTREHGSFEIKEASLFIEAQVWENTSLFLELQTNRLGADDAKFTRTGEVYIRLQDLQVTDNTSIGLKLGRFDIPFGEEYLWQDAIDNPLITNSAAYPYGWDEGVLVYGTSWGVNWIAAVTDGTDARSEEENGDKAYNLKLYGNLTDNLYLSASYMMNGSGTKSALEFGGSHFEPVSGSSAGTSTSTEVDSELFEMTAKYNMMIANKKAYLALTGGLANQDDDDAVFDRDLRWFAIESHLQINRHWYSALRYSEIGTYDNDEGYHFDGKTFADGNSAFGFDTQRFSRFGIGLGWQPNPHFVTKLELGRDSFYLIDSSPLSDSDRTFFGVETAVKF